MSPINLAIVGLRLLAIYCFVQSLPLFAALGFVAAVTVPNAFSQPQSESVILSLLPAGLLLLLAVLLFALSVPFAHWLTRPTSAEPKENVCTFEQFQAIAFAVAGILILATVLPSVGRALQDLVALYYYHKQGGTNPADRIYSSWLYCTGVVAQLVLGLLLLLNPKGFRNVWRWLRTTGT
jgi:hypothetical protein